MATFSNLLIVLVMMTTVRSIFAAHGTFSNQVDSIVKEIEGEEDKLQWTDKIKSKIVTKGMRNLCDDNNKLVRISACIKFVQNMNRGGTKFSLIVPLKDKLSCDKVHVGGAKNNPSVKMFKCPETVVSFSADRVTVEEPFMIGQSKTPNERTVRAFRTAARSGTYDLATVVGQLKNFEFGVLGMEKTTGENTFTMTYTYDLANPRSNDDDDAGASSPSSPSNYPGSTKYIKLN